MIARGKISAGLLLALTIMSLAWTSPAFASGLAQKDPLTEQETDQLREYGDRPLEKLKLYLGYIEERTSELHRLSSAGNAQDHAVQIHNLYEEFTRLSDELQDNMDSFQEQHADMRKILKTIVEKSGNWPAILNEPKANSSYDFVRKTALSAVESVHDAATQMLADEEKYFAQHKADKSGI